MELMLSLCEINVSTYTLNIYDKEVYQGASEVVPGKHTADVEIYQQRDLLIEHIWMHHGVFGGWLIFGSWCDTAIGVKSKNVINAILAWN